MPKPLYRPYHLPTSTGGTISVPTDTSQRRQYPSDLASKGQRRARGRGTGAPIGRPKGTTSRSLPSQPAATAAAEEAEAEAGGNLRPIGSQEDERHVDRRTRAQEVGTSSETRTGTGAEAEAEAGAEAGAGAGAGDGAGDGDAVADGMDGHGGWDRDKGSHNDGQGDGQHQHQHQLQRQHVLPSRKTPDESHDESEVERDRGDRPRPSNYDLNGQVDVPDHFETAARQRPPVQSPKAARMTQDILPSDEDDRSVDDDGSQRDDPSPGQEEAQSQPLNRLSTAALRALAYKAVAQHQPFVAVACLGYDPQVPPNPWKQNLGRR